VITAAHFGGAVLYIAVSKNINLEILRCYFVVKIEPFIETVGSPTCLKAKTVE
jgi:hypothetical protein